MMDLGYVESARDEVRLLSEFLNADPQTKFASYFLEMASSELSKLLENQGQKGSGFASGQK